MEMIDVLTKLKEIAEKKPELVKDAVENVEKTNPKVDEGKMKDYLHGEAEKLSREEFLKKHGESLRGFYNAINGDEDDDDAIGPLANEGSQSNAGNMTGDAGGTATAKTKAIDNPANPDSPVLSDAADHANKNVILDVAPDGMAEDTVDRAFNKTGGNTSDEVADEISNETFADDHPGKTAPPDQIQALADIADAIYQARQQAVDTVVADASQNNAVPFDMDVLSAAVADEVRRTVSEVIIAELPQMMRDAVSEAIRALPADVRGQSTPTTGNPPTAKRVTARKTAAIKKAVAKKTGTKKAGTKKPAAKKTANNKASAKKTAPST